MPTVSGMGDTGRLKAGHGTKQITTSKRKAEGERMKPRLLDLFCGAGGAAMGYHQAGFEVVGVDHNPQPHYPFEFIPGDALDYLEWLMRSGYPMPDAIHASPPCQAYCAMKTMTNAREHPDLLEPVRKLLKATGKPYVIENVKGAPLIDAFRLCGSSFNLQTTDGHQLQRHRYFETTMEILFVPPCQHTKKTIGIYGDKARDIAKEKRHYAKPKETRGPPVDVKIPLSEALKAMGIDWMSAKELSQAIPPAYTELIGKYLLQEIRVLTSE